MLQQSQECPAHQSSSGAHPSCTSMMACAGGEDRRFEAAKASRLLIKHKMEVLTALKKMPTQVGCGGLVRLTMCVSRAAVAAVVDEKSVVPKACCSTSKRGKNQL